MRVKRPHVHGWSVRERSSGWRVIDEDGRGHYVKQQQYDVTTTANSDSVILTNLQLTGSSMMSLSHIMPRMGLIDTETVNHAINASKLLLIQTQSHQELNLTLDKQTVRLSGYGIGRLLKSR